MSGYEPPRIAVSTLLQRVVGVAVVLDGDVDLGVRRVETLRRGRQRLALDVDVAVPEHDVGLAAARRAGAEPPQPATRTRSASGEEAASERLIGAPPIVSGCGGCQGRARAACASAIASRWARTSEASGSASGVEQRRPGRADVGRRGRGRAHPWGRRACGASASGDRAVPVLHGGVRLAPRAGRLAQLERGLVRQPHRPAPAEEVEAVEARRGRPGAAARARPRPPRPRAPCRCPGVRSSSTSAAVANLVCTTERSSANGQRTGPPGRARQRALGDRGEGHGRNALADDRHGVEHLGRRARAGDRPAAASYARPAGNSEAANASVSPRPPASRAAAYAVATKSDVPQPMTAHAGAVARQDVRRPPSRPSLAPDGRLARDLLLDCAHIG